MTPPAQHVHVSDTNIAKLSKVANIAKVAKGKRAKSCKSFKSMKSWKSTQNTAHVTPPAQHFHDFDKKRLQSFLKLQILQKLQNGKTSQKLQTKSKA